MAHDTADEIYDDLLALIDEYGWAVRHVTADEETGAAQFSYTIGLTALGSPEIVMTGMPFEHAHSLLNLAGRTVRDGRPFAAGEFRTDLTDSGSVFLLQVQDYGGLVAIRQVYGRADALQLVWPDSTGAFPWEAGYRNAPGAQPLLGELPPSHGV